MFMAALLTIAEKWKQPKCPSMDEQILQILYIQNGKLLDHEKVGNPAIWHNMDGP